MEGTSSRPPGIEAASVHHAYCEHVAVEPVELQCTSQSSPSNDCHADRGQDDCPPGCQALNVHQADLAHAVFAHVKLPSHPSSDHRPEPWSRHQAAVRQDVWIVPPSLLVGQSPERRSRQVTGPQVPLTLAARGPVVISRATHFPARLGVVPGGLNFICVLVSKSGNKSLINSMNYLVYTLPHASSFDIHNKSNLHFPCSVPGKNLIVTTKRRLEYPEHINVPVQTVTQEDGENVGMRVDN